MKRTKRTLFYSIVSLVLCFAMLAGTTYAWFTESVTSVNNIIKTGELDLQVLWTKDLSSGDWKDAEKTEDGPVFYHENWEPGYTAIRYIKIVNAGSLAFKYALNIICDGDAGILGDVIDVYYVENTTANKTSLDDYTEAGVLNDVISGKVNVGGVLLPEGKTKDNFYTGEIIIAIALHMQENAGNEYQDKSVGKNFAIQLLATQYDYESDDLGNGYDDNATFPNIVDADVVLDVSTDNGLTTEDVQKSENGIGVNLRKGTKVNGTQVGVSMEAMAQSGANLQLDDGEELVPLNVHAEGVAEDNDVPLVIDLGEVMPKGLNMGNYSLYHVENGTTVAMTLVSSVDELDAHNEFYYDPATGVLVVAMATFSEVALVADTENAWNGTVADAFAGGAGTEADPYLIANADQLALLGELISNDNANYGDKHYKLIADINLGGDDENADGHIFYPIGYRKVGTDVATVEDNDAPEFVYIDEIEDEGDDEGDEVLGTADYAAGRSGASTVADSGSTDWYTFGGAFEGVFDGNGNTIKNIYQNTWQMKGDYEGDKHYWNDAMGIFGYVYGGTVKNLTVNNFTSDGEFTPTGVIAAYAAGDSTFENIAITNCNPRVYNTGNGGIIGIAGSTNAANDDHITLKNITIDNSNKISALWGSWDVACGGLVGMYRGNVDGNGNATGDTISFENCHVAAQIDVYNDVCANYQYYAYRYAGMIIGSVRHNTTNSDGRTVPNMTGISASGCTVNFGDWNDYYYCEFEKNSIASYSPDYQFSRVPHSELNFTDSNGNGVVDADERGSVTGCKHDHTAEENHQAIYLPFHQLFTGYSWGVSSVGLKEYSGIVTDLGITEGDNQESVSKFEGIGTIETYRPGQTITVGDLFKEIAGIKVPVVDSSVYVSVSPATENDKGSATYKANATDWTKGTITFSNDCEGSLKIVITDYFFCVSTTIVLGAHEHVYDNACDAKCNDCGEAREADDHVYDNACDATCNVCGAGRTLSGHVYDNNCDAICNVCHAEREVGDHVYTNECDAYCNECGATREVGDHIYDNACDTTCNTCGAIREVSDHIYDNACDTTCNTCGAIRDVSDHVYNNACDADCNVCGADRTITHAPADAVIENKVESTCTVAGHYDSVVYCSVCDKELDRETVALELIAHKYSKEVIKPTCTTGGYTTYTCACGDTYVADKVDKLNHTYDAVVTAPTCTAEGYTTYTCTCGDTYKEDYVAALGHIEKKFTGDFLYRVGNQNAVSIGSLFGIGNRESVKITGSTISGNATVTQDVDSLKFSGTGVIEITLSSDCTCGECQLELTLEVVNATNVAENGKIGNYNTTSVLLGNTTISTLYLNGGATLYGNGFTIDCTNSPFNGSGSVSENYIIELVDAHLDNVKVVGMVYTEYGAMASNNYNRALVVSKGNSTITNCYLSNTAAPIRLVEGSLYVKGTTVKGGNFANIDVRNGHLTVEDVTTINQALGNDKAENGATVIGLGIVVYYENVDTALTSITVKGTLTQYNHISSANTFSHEYATTLVNEMMSNTYADLQFTVDGVTWVNPGIIEMTKLKQRDGYEGKDIRFYAQDGYVYAVKPTEDSVEVIPGDYTTIGQGAIAPTYSFDYTGKNYQQKVDGSNDYCYYENGKVLIAMDQGDTFNWDPFILTATKYGQTLNYTVTMNGKTYAADEKIAFNASGDYVVTYTYIDGSNYTVDENGNLKAVEVTYTKTVTISVSVIKPTTQHATFTFADTNTATQKVTVGDKTYISAAGVSATDKEWGYITVNGTKIFYPITEAQMKTSSKLLGGKETQVYYYVFKDAVTITDYKDGGTGGAQIYNSETKSMPSNLTVVNGMEAKYTAISSACVDVSKLTKKGSDGEVWDFSASTTVSGTTTYNNYLAHSSPSGLAVKDGTRDYDAITVAQFSYTDAAGATYYYFVGYFMPNQNTSDSGSGGDSPCVTPDTLITLADGTQKRIDQVTNADKLLAWDFFKGEYAVVSPAIIFDHGIDNNTVIKLNFSDGTSVKVVNLHQFFDADLNKYVSIDADSVANYVGHEFAKIDGTVTLVDYEISEEYVEAWGIISAGHYNIIVEGMISTDFMLEDYDLFNYFEVGENMMFDQDQMQADIEKYGLYTYEEFADYLTYEQFVAFNVQYFKIAVGKGDYTYEGILELINTYLNK